MPKMSSINADSLAILEASNVLPIDLFVSKRWPSMSLALSQEFLDGSSLWGLEEGLAGDRIVVDDGGATVLLDVLNPCL